MSELAGLVIGHAGLLALFESCMSAFESVDSGRAYGREYQKAALQIALLQLRLSRWKQTVDIREDLTGVSAQLQVAKPIEVEIVRLLLSRIHNDLETAERSSKRFALESIPQAEEGTKDAATMNELSHQVRKVALSRQRGSSFGQKQRWALQDKRTFKLLIEKLERSIEELASLFPGTSKRQTELAAAEVTEIIEPDSLLQSEEAVTALQESSRGIDEQMVEAVERMAATQDRFSFKNMVVEQNARALFGNYFGDGMPTSRSASNAVGPSSGYIDITATARGRSRVHYGENIGGSYVLSRRDSE